MNFGGYAIRIDFNRLHRNGKHGVQSLCQTGFSQVQFSRVNGAGRQVIFDWFNNNGFGGGHFVDDSFNGPATDLKLILTTHKIYGPLYRLRVYIKKLSEGEPADELRFRKGDAIHGLKEIYMDLRKSLEKTLHYDYEEMVRVFSELQLILDKVYTKQIKEKELSDSLQEICDRLAKALDKTSEAIEKE